MKTLLSSGDSVEITAGGDVTAGVGLLTGQLFGVPENSGASGDLITVQVEGIVTIAKTDELEVAVGDALYWDDTEKEVNKTTTNQKEVGIAVSACADTAGIVTIDMLLVPTVRVDNTEGV